MDFRGKQVVFCLDCGSCLGIYRPFYATEHLEKFPSHQNFLTITIIDPLVLDNPDEWFNQHIPLMKKHQTSKLNKKNFDDETSTSYQNYIS